MVGDLGKKTTYKIFWSVLVTGLLILLLSLIFNNFPFSDQKSQIFLVAFLFLVSVILLIIKSKNTQKIHRNLHALLVSIDSLADIAKIKQHAEKDGFPAALDSLQDIALENIKIIRTSQENLAKQNQKLKSAYNELKESKSKYEQLIKNLEAEYFFYTRTPKNKFIYFSHSVEKILGYSIQELLEKGSQILAKSTNSKETGDDNQQKAERKLHDKYLTKIKNNSGESCVLEIIEVPVKNNNGVTTHVEGLAHDISDRFFAQEHVKEQEAIYRQIFNYASDFIFIHEIINGNESGKFIEVNAYMKKILGYKEDELYNLTPDNLEAAEIWNESHEKTVGGKYERIWVTKDGEIINVEISEQIFNLKSRKACIAVARDISDRKRALEEIKFMNEELVNQKENLEALLDNLTQTQEQLVQSEKMAALGQLIAGVAHEINTPLGAIKASVGNLRDSLDSNMVQLPKMLASKSPKDIELFIKAFELSQTNKIDYSSREKREKKRALRTKLRESEVESAEMLADLLAYMDLYNNIDELFDLLHSENALEVLKNVRNSISLVKNTNTISIASEKASKVVFALKKYAHRDSLGEKVPTDILDGIETVLTLYDNQLKQGIKLHKDFNEMPLVMCYQDEINQVWTNLIQNSIQAMGTQGILTIRAFAGEKFAEVIVTDTGEGIEPTIMNNIFEPFFTTKKQGEGSGLGLDIVKKIIDKHGGHIHVKSQIGEGATFTVQIPLY